MAAADVRPSAGPIGGVDDPEQEPGEHQARRDLGVDPRAAVVGAMAVGDLLRQPLEVEDPVHPDQNLVVRDQVAERPATNRSACLRSPFPNMSIARRTTTPAATNPPGFFNKPRMK